jgi:hypothetical protein
MKQFLRLFIIFSLPVLILGIVTEIALRKIPNDYLYKRNYLDQHSKGVKILFLGNSHAFYGINPEYIKPESFNASYVSQSFNYDLEILKRYANKWDSLRYIVVVFDYPALHSRLEKGAEAWRAKNYSIYYQINLTNNIADKTEFFNNNLKLASKRLVNFYIKGVSSITTSKSGWGNDYTFKNKKDLLVTGKTAAQKHKVSNYLAENTESLKQLIYFAKAKNIKVILFTPPAYKTYVQNLGINQLNETINVATNLAKLYNHVVYFNFINDTDFIADDYFDADHLNEAGAKKLTIKIDSAIIKLQDNNATNK